ncbi:hypothetical protein [Burkholderia anthina]|uniref:hypothetical protein n=1 Tax=Burkholderia anthina TaxID=179879 RepID=UPI0037C19A07
MINTSTSSPYAHSVVTVYKSVNVSMNIQAASRLFDEDEVALVNQIEAMERILVQQREERDPNEQTLWTPTVTRGTLAFGFGVVVSFGAFGGTARTLKERREERRQERLNELRSKIRTLNIEIEKGRRNPNQRMFDAIQAHHHDALRRAIADGADVRIPYGDADSGNTTVSDERQHSNGIRISFRSLHPLQWAVLEDDPVALDILMEALGEAEAEGKLPMLRDLTNFLAQRRNPVPCPKVTAVLEARVMREALQEVEEEATAEPVRARGRARL